MFYLFIYVAQVLSSGFEIIRKKKKKKQSLTKLYVFLRRSHVHFRSGFVWSDCTLIVHLLSTKTLIVQWPPYLPPHCSQERFSEHFLERKNWSYCSSWQPYVQAENRWGSLQTKWCCWLRSKEPRVELLRRMPHHRWSRFSPLDCHGDFVLEMDARLWSEH